MFTTTKFALYFAEWVSEKGYVFTADKQWINRTTPYNSVANSTIELYELCIIDFTKLEIKENTNQQ